MPNGPADLPSSELKSVLRKERLAARAALTPDERRDKADAMARHGVMAIAVEAGSLVSGFFPIRSEADIRPLMADLADRGARLCLPVVMDKETIEFRAYAPGVPLVETGFGTMGPGEDAAVVDPDIMLVPLAAFDREGHRIGYGGGYYDRAIEKLQQKGRKPKLFGIAFDVQEVAKVPFEPHDVRLDGVLTESGFRSFG
jgi:5-formyltetrahydrofolate cyclo-ligase